MSPTTPRSRRRRAGAALVSAVLVAGLALASCGDDDGDGDVATDPAAETTTTAAPGPGTFVAGDMEASAVWARTSPVVASAGAAYLDLTNVGEEDDALVSASVDATVAARVELHETRAAGGMGGRTETTMGQMGSTSTPMMEMVPVDRIEVPAGETVALEPGGLHIMLLELVEPLVEGAEVEITLAFEVAGELVVTAVVGDGPPAGA